MFLLGLVFALNRAFGIFFANVVGMQWPKVDKAQLQMPKVGLQFLF